MPSLPRVVHFVLPRWLVQPIGKTESLDHSFTASEAPVSNGSVSLSCTEVLEKNDPEIDVALGSLQRMLFEVKSEPSRS